MQSAGVDQTNMASGEARLRNRVTLAVTIASLLVAGLGLLSWQMSRFAAQDADQIVRTYQASRRLQLALRHADDVETGVRGFALTGKEAFLEPYVSGKKGFAARFRAIAPPDQRSTAATPAFGNPAIRDG